MNTLKVHQREIDKAAPASQHEAPELVGPRRRRVMMDWPSEALAGFAAAEDRELLRNLAKSDVNVLLEVRSHWEGSGDMKGTIVITSRGPGNDITHATIDHGVATTLIIPLQPGEALLLRAEDKANIGDFHRSPSEHGYRFRIL